MISKNKKCRQWINGELISAPVFSLTADEFNTALEQLWFKYAIADDWEGKLFPSRETQKQRPTLDGLPQEKREKKDNKFLVNH